MKPGVTGYAGFEVAQEKLHAMSFESGENWHIRIYGRFIEGLVLDGNFTIFYRLDYEKNESSANVLCKRLASSMQEGDDCMLNSLSINC